MTPRQHNLLTAVSLVLCVAVVASWLRSYLPEQFHARTHRGQILLVFSAQQHSYLFRPDRNFPIEEVVPVIYRFTDGDPGGVRFAFAGFAAALSDRQLGFWFFAVPHWALALPLAALAVWGLRTSRRRRFRAAAGKCLECGYDLRASDGRCPECGTAPKADGSAAATRAG